MFYICTQYRMKCSNWNICNSIPNISHRPQFNMKTLIFRKKTLLIIRSGIVILLILIVLLAILNSGVDQSVIEHEAPHQNGIEPKSRPKRHERAINISRMSHSQQSNPGFVTRRTQKEVTGIIDQKKGIFDDPYITQNDSRIIDYLIEYQLYPPPLNYVMNNINSQTNPSELAIQLFLIFGNKTNGVFIEAGANDGNFLSNTLALERDLGWTGLLVEANKIIFPELKKSGRNSWIANLCLAVKPTPHKVNILHRVGSEEWFKGNGMVEPNSDVPPPPSYFHIRPQFISAGITECFPLFSILSAINMTRIDYFSLDVEGVELKILKTIPFDSVDIKVISVEHFIAPEGKEAIRFFMMSKGYQTFMENGQEFIFIKKGYEMVNPSENMNFLLNAMLGLKHEVV